MVFIIKIHLSRCSALYFNPRVVWANTTSHIYLRCIRILHAEVPILCVALGSDICFCTPASAFYMLLDSSINRFCHSLSYMHWQPLSITTTLAQWFCCLSPLWWHFKIQYTTSGTFLPKPPRCGNHSWGCRSKSLPTNFSKAFFAREYLFLAL